MTDARTGSRCVGVDQGAYPSMLLYPYLSEASGGKPDQGILQKKDPAIATGRQQSQERFRQKVGITLPREAAHW